jgi:two-component system NarL family response regulator
MRILLADDHPLFTEGLRNVLVGRGLDVIGTARDGVEALELTRKLKPDVVLIDINMPRRNGLEATKLIKAEMPDVRVVILTMSEEDDDLFNAIRNGASGYLVKSLEPDLFMSLLLGLTKGQAPISREMAAKIMTEFARWDGRATSEIDTHPTEEDLTPRQIEVLKLVADGRTYKEVAATLGIAERTVEYHMSEILSRLQLRNRAQVLAYAMRKGLLSSGANDGPASP